MKERNPYKRQKENILKLRAKGFSYRRISRELGCARSTISYHCGKNESEKNRVKKRQINPLCRKVGHFRSRCTSEAYRTFRNKIKGFRKKKEKSPRKGSYARVNNINKPYNCSDVIKKISDKPLCYLTGRRINLSNPSTYHLDHITPTCNGGTNDLFNMGICSAEANQAKGSLSVKEFHNLCEEVLSWRDKLDK
jgi:hypothetical protein